MHKLLSSNYNSSDQLALEEALLSHQRLVENLQSLNDEHNQYSLKFIASFQELTHVKR
jgi:hypothetical protein